MISGFAVLLALAAPSCLAVPVADPVADADPSAYASDYSQYLPAPSSQFHAQDDFGGYNYGFASHDQQKSEVRSADGVVRGSYSYIDANGVIQTTNYISDALGFRVAATNLPVHNVEGEAYDVVEAAPAPAVAVAAPADDHVMVPSVPYSYLPYATNYGYQFATPAVQAQAAPVVQAAYAAAPFVQAHAAPVVQAAYAASPVVQTHAAPVVQAAYAAAPFVQAYAAPVVQPHAAPVVHAAASVPLAYAAAPVVQAAVPVVTGSQYHAQDEAGQYSFGYNDLNSVRQETKTADGAVSGAYQYVDTDGHIQSVQYIADEAGFRVAGTNLPVFAAAVPSDTPEVAAAKIQHAYAVAEANAIHAADVAAAYVAAPVQPIPAIQAPAAVEPALVPDLAEGYYGAAQVYAASPVVAPALAPKEYEPALVPDLAEGYYGAAQVYAASPVVAPALAPEEYEAAEALLQGYYGAANVYSGAPIVAGAPVATVYNTPSIVHAGVHASPIAVASASPVAVASADPIFVGGPEATGYQYHSQDDFGQYSFGYSDGNSGKQEIKTADGVIRGSYSYVDSDGIIQTVNYIADALGFRVGATNLPVHHVEGATAVAAPVVQVASAEPAAVAYQGVEVAPAPVMTPQVAYSYLPYAVNYGYHQAPVVATDEYQTVSHVAAPVAVASAAPLDVGVYAAAPTVHAAAVPIVAAPAGEVSSQYHAQDELGAYSYGYSSANQAKTEVKSADGVTRGSYSYVDANGLLQTVNYISDAMGFRVAATNLPVHYIEGAEAVEDTPAVVEAAKYSVLTPSVNYAYLPYASNYDYLHSEPAAIAAGAA